MSKIYIIISILSCLAGIIGFVGGVSIAHYSESKAIQMGYDVQRICTSAARPRLGRGSVEYQNYLFLEVLRSNDKELMHDFEALLIPSVAQYAAELTTAIENNEVDGGTKFYKETLSDIEKLLGLTPHNKSLKLD